MEEKGLILRSCDLSKGTGKGRVCSSACVSKRKINANYRSEMGSVPGGAAPQPDPGAEHRPCSPGRAGMSGAGQPRETLQGSLTARKTYSSSQMCQSDKFNWFVCKAGGDPASLRLKKFTGYHARVPSCFNTSQTFLCIITRGGKPSW